MTLSQSVKQSVRQLVNEWVVQSVSRLTRWQRQKCTWGVNLCDIEGHSEPVKVGKYIWYFTREQVSIDSTNLMRLDCSWLHVFDAFFSTHALSFQTFWLIARVAVWFHSIASGVALGTSAPLHRSRFSDSTLMSDYYTWKMMRGQVFAFRQLRPCFWPANWFTNRSTKNGHLLPSIGDRFLHVRQKSRRQPG